MKFSFNSFLTLLLTKCLNKYYKNKTVDNNISHEPYFLPPTAKYIMIKYLIQAAILFGL